MKWYTPPKNKFQFGQCVKVTWHKERNGMEIGTITGINFDHTQGVENQILYTITEAKTGIQFDMIHEVMIEPITVDDYTDNEDAPVQIHVYWRDFGDVDVGHNVWTDDACAHGDSVEDALKNLEGDDYYFNRNEYEWWYRVIE